MMMLIPTDILRAAMICASTEATRYYLGGVYIDPKGFVVSTDGCRLFCAPFEATKQFEGFTIPTEALKKALSGYKGKDVEVSATHIDALGYQPIDGTFPDWRRVVPSEFSGEVAQFNAEYVGDLAKMAKALGYKYGADVEIAHNGAGAAGVVFGEGCKAFVVLMPVRGSGDTAGRFLALRAAI